MKSTSNHFRLTNTIMPIFYITILKKRFINITAFDKNIRSLHVPLLHLRVKVVLTFERELTMFCK